MGIFRNLKGTQEDSFQIGLKTAPLLQRVGTTARLRLSDLLRWLPGGSAVAGFLISDGSGDLTIAKSEFNKAVDPTVNDDGSTGGYSIGSRWLNTTNDTEWVCLNNDTAAAVWRNTAGDVIGPASSIDYGMAVFDGTTGKIIQDSGKRNYGGSATDPTSPSPAAGDLYYNTAIKMWMSYDAVRVKWLSIDSTTFYAGNQGVTPPGAYYQGLGGRTLSAADGYTSQHNGTIVALGYSRTDTDSADFEVTAGGSTITTVNSAAISGSEVTTNNNFSSGDILAVRNKSGGNATSNVQVWIKMKWRP